MKDSRKESYEKWTHIQKAVNEIETFTRNVSKEAFINEHLL